MRHALPDIPARRALLGPERIAFEDGLTGRTWSYAAFEDRSARAAAVLTACGVEPGARVAVLCRNRVAFFEVMMGCARIGAIFVPLNWRMPPAELDGLLADCTPALLVFGAEDAETMGALAAALPARLALDDGGADGYEARMDRAAPLAGRSHWPVEDCWYLLYTSGTTGRPKAVIQTYGMALANYVNTVQAAGLSADDTTLNYLPLFHTAGINLYTLPTLMGGGRTVILPGFDVDRVLGLLEAGRIDTFFAVPQVYQALSLHPRFETLDFSKIRSLGCGGAPMPTAMAARFAERGAMVINGYGMTETGPTCFFATPETMAAKPGCAGRAQLLVSARIVDGAGQAVPDGVAGELLVAGPAVTPGYWNRPEETARAITPDGWLRTGDLVLRDGDGDHFIVGRSKDMYISGGENVYPAEVEEVLNSHPDVLEAAVIGVPDAQWGEVGEAHILPRPGHCPDAADLAAFARARLAAYKVPKQFVFVVDFPRTASGKVIKHALAVDPDGAG
ncbi:MAG: AMP-binding protein [Alphaproteobacteria bacterium]